MIIHKYNEEDTYYFHVEKSIVMQYAKSKQSQHLCHILIKVSGANLPKIYFKNYTGSSAASPIVPFESICSL